MTDNEDNNAEELVASDSQIYGAVTNTRGGATIEHSAERPELPNLHADVRSVDPTDPIRTWPSDHDYYFVCAESRSGGSNNYFTVAYPLENGIEVSGSRLHVPDRSGGVRFGHSISTPYVDEAVCMSRQRLEEAGLTFEVDESGQRAPNVDSIDVISELEDVPLDHEHSSTEGEWTHGYTELDGRDFEIFIPTEEAEFVTEHSNVFIPFTENSITVSSHTERRPVTERQDGLYVRHVHQVDEYIVPDIDNYTAERELVAEDYQ